jgi:hypothetical protein
MTAGPLSNQMCVISQPASRIRDLGVDKSMHEGARDSRHGADREGISDLIIGRAKRPRGWYVQVFANEDDAKGSHSPWPSEEKVGWPVQGAYKEVHANASFGKIGKCRVHLVLHPSPAGSLVSGIWNPPN